MENSDHRRATRVNISNEAILEYGGRSLRVSAMNLSARGLCVWAPGPVSTAPMRVTMSLADRPVILRGRLARQFESDGGAVWGIEFEPESDEQSLQIVADFAEAA